MDLFKVFVSTSRLEFGAYYRNKMWTKKFIPHNNSDHIVHYPQLGIFENTITM